MKKLNLLSLLIFILVYNILQAEYNFELKNSSAKTLYFSLGNKEHDPINDGIKTIQPGGSFRALMDMAKHPEFLVSWFYPYAGCKVYLYEIDSASKAKKIFLQVDNQVVASEAIIIPQKKYFVNNVSAQDLKKSKIIYKPAKAFQDPYVFISHFLQNEFYVSAPNLNARSNSFDLLGLRLGASASEIVKRYEQLMSRVAYLQEHTDLNKLYKKITDIWSNAFKLIMHSAGG